MPYRVDDEGRVIDESEAPRGAGRAVVDRGGALSLTRIFMYMFVGLLITAGISVGLGLLFRNIFAGADIDAMNNAAIAYLVILIVSGLSVLVLSILLNVFLYKGKSLWVPSILYVVSMGVLLSAFTIFVDWGVLGLAFGITAGAFGLMALIAFLSKGNLSGLAIAGLGLLIGAMLLSIVNVILYFATGGAWSTLYIVISFILLAAMMLITIFDMWRIKKICEKGEMSTNLELYCAFTLYVDFVYILIRIIYIILLSKRR